MSDDDLDRLPYGVIGMDRTGSTVRYNAMESELAGLSQKNVLGQHFFNEVAPCMNNFLVAERMYHEVDLDDVIPYVLSFRMKPTKVLLRLLSASDAERMYILIDREG